jgi:hypothetical protein
MSVRTIPDRKIAQFSLEDCLLRAMRSGSGNHETHETKEFKDHG